MDTIEDEPDIWLQRASADLIADFNQSLPEFLRKQNGIDDGSHGRVNSKLRTRVRVSETRRMAFSVRINARASHPAELSFSLLDLLPVIHYTS